MNRVNQMKLLMEWMEKNEIILWIGIIQWVHMKSNLLTRLVLCQIYQLLGYGLIKEQPFKKGRNYFFSKAWKLSSDFYDTILIRRNTIGSFIDSSISENRKTTPLWNVIRKSFTSQFATIIDFIWHERKMIYTFDICCYLHL